jgi:hypothetical protein
MLHIKNLCIVTDSLAKGIVHEEQCIVKCVTDVFRVESIEGVLKILVVTELYDTRITGTICYESASIRISL